MTEYSEKLPLRSGVTLKNRLMMSPMTTRQSFFDGQVTRDEIAYYQERSQGLGAVITGAANVQAGGKGWPGELSVASDDMIPQLHDLASAIQGQGAKAILQIFHAGRMTSRATLSGEQPVSASAVAAERPEAETPRELTDAEIESIIRDFGEATKRAIVAGFDGVELHGANTYLLQQFFSPHSNRRTDKWGGDRTQRAAFVRRVIESTFAAVKETADRPFLVGYRLSPEEFETPGIRFDDTLYLLTQLQEFPLDYIHVSLGNYDRVARGTDYQDKSMMAYMYEALNGQIPLVGVGGVRTRQDVANVLQEADLVAVGQQLLFDPKWAVKLALHQDKQMVTADFGSLVMTGDFTLPLRDFLERRYNK
ncbi:NADH-dependent flavin oxidoreductase [Levilactobacillus humaensis]|uniref:NADH-dependent flavin oxidoreductase n=1 Tax=Levilactobacillus humaensis TaxID=2950375 RepID=UPI0021C2A09A|nr:NADH-dependent flavin oxidoreductase [Levilactobacillus humaensis]